MNSDTANIACSNASCECNWSFSNAAQNKNIAYNYYNRIVLVSLTNGIGYQVVSCFMTRLDITKHFSRTDYFSIASKCELGVI